MKGLTAKFSGFIFVISFVIFGLNSDPYPQALLDSTKAYIRKMPKARISEGEKGTEQVQNRAQVGVKQSDSSGGKRFLWIDLELKTQEDLEFLKSLGLTCCFDMGRVVD
jgi:hypothetical protein